MAARGSVNINCIKHISLVMVLRVAVILLMAFGFLLYVSIFISPALLCKVLPAMVPCNEDDNHSKAVITTASNAMLFTPKLSHAAMDSAVRRNEMKEEHSRVEYMEFEDSTSERSDRTRTSASTTYRGGAAGSGNKQEDKDEQILKECNAMADDDILMQGRRNGEEQNTRDLNKFTILVGVMTMASKIDRRSLLRLAYGVQSSPDAHISVRFVIGGLEGEIDRTLVGMENATYGDIIVLNCSENLNEGKTFAFFSSLRDSGVEYDYVMKTDDDSYIRFDNLGRSLKYLPRTDLYYGYILPCENDDPYSWYMAGMGYLISWDLVLWIGESPIARNKSVGTEDQLVGDWFNEGGVAKHRVNEKPLFYDHPEFGGKCAHELVPETILVHQVKTKERWANVLGFFEKDRISRALSLSQANQSRRPTTTN